ncbi:gamma-glutamyl-gamma-aminobutyrate hydrolase [Salinibacter sp. 10B]|uniref:gamma-glutamyl-gamma-aminobutyrate hydrolase family protein n=1 Tax=Salinibacter sp. 10B TaxID=1923971 RepID=UPI000CF4E7EE|nr:type 1 glutamine amidotransferase [Salinibacter sp. 10B]PQJ35767.1 gamma-glutamyl-gamma-aminobutyrate hydrolase [Salinibacter sp. 10B]
MAPRIGITTSYDEGTQSLDRRYITAVERAGGQPLPLPMGEAETSYAGLVEVLNGLVVIGGPAVTEGLVGTLPDELGTLGSVRAESDREWIERAWAADVPILGICYGMQRLNALAGGTIYGDVEREQEGAQTHSQKRGATTHPVDIQSDRLREYLGTDTVTVNTRHLQAIADVGAGFSVAATAPDGVIEAIEHESGKIFGVQFHPERMGEAMQPLFQWLVAEAVPSSTAPA